ncbi:chromate transporter [Oharaeibacter diazotrophicus]|uniref:Chromate transporter n=1 Tax=Oharaeibacter diazotrophicus TaxID=1920512 RepID=A0A4R6RHA8_9HYPH|nr:chromate transporter [Oharaeibacter diazotrophicus]TDP85545.1 chromate transporter [Oharaeibacter diazotrophicus]BBE74516.1 putative chromate transport protein [Pleomorphomonas sp. SM30]GLS75785.1 hypothetical protein GCM10007904_11200 [Oharaeibacter diazotrophicus]
MSEAAAAPARAETVGLGAMFLTFLGVGATSFGGGVVAYLRHALVARRGWVDDDGFISALEVAQALPGLNATNLAVIVGDRLRGPIGAVVALVALVLPGAVAVTGLAAVYAAHSGDPRVNAALIGVGAAAVGLLAATVVQIGRRTVHGATDVVLALATVAAVAWLKLPLPLVLVTLGPVAVLLHRPRPTGGEGRP